jgi:hypothetical protein
MKRFWIAILVALGLLFLAGCFKHTFTVGTGAESGKVVYHHWHHHWLFGIIGEENLNMAEICPSGNATIHSEMSFLNGIVDLLIGFIYSPTTVTIRCDDGTQTEVELNEEQVSRLVTDPRFLSLVGELVPERLAEAEAAVRNLQSGSAQTRVVQAGTPLVRR